MEQSGIDVIKDIMRVQERLLVSVLRAVNKEAKAELESDDDEMLDDKSARTKTADYWLKVCKPEKAWDGDEYFSRRVGFGKSCSNRISGLQGQSLKVTPHALEQQSQITVCFVIVLNTLQTKYMIYNNNNKHMFVVYVLKSTAFS